MRASSIPLKHQKEIMEWLSKQVQTNKGYLSGTPDWIVYADYLHAFTDPLTNRPIYLDISKSKFTRFLHTQGITRRTRRINGHDDHVYGIDTYSKDINDRLEFRQPSKHACEHCDGTGWIYA